EDLPVEFCSACLRDELERFGHAVWFTYATIESSSSARSSSIPPQCGSSRSIPLERESNCFALRAPCPAGLLRGRDPGHHGRHSVSSHLCRWCRAHHAPQTEHQGRLPQSPIRPPGCLGLSQRR